MQYAEVICASLYHNARISKCACSLKSMCGLVKNMRDEKKKECEKEYRTKIGDKEIE